MPTMIDHTIGKRLPPTEIARISGSASFVAIQLPTRAPMKPTATETRQPPWLYPAIARPTDDAGSRCDRRSRAAPR